MDKDHLTVYERTIEKEFSFLKETTSLEDLFTKGIELSTSAGMLVPISALNQDDLDLVVQIAEWYRSAKIRLSHEVTADSTTAGAWLKNTWSRRDSIVFLMFDKHGQRVGYLGFGNCFNDEHAMEITHLVAGTESAQKMTFEAISVLIRWAQTTLFPDHIFVRLSTANETVVSLFRKLHFVEHGGGSNDVTKMVLQPPPDTVGNTMILTAGPSISAREANYAFRRIIGQRR